MHGSLRRAVKAGKYIFKALVKLLEWQQLLLFKLKGIIWRTVILASVSVQIIL